SHYLPAGALHPAQALYQKAQIVNDQEYPVAVHYAGGGDSGSIADYLFEWLSGWQDVTLLPGEATPVFQLQLGMPAAAPNGSQGTSGRYWWQWTLHRVAQPVAEDDSSSTAYQTPITIADLANDHLDDGSALPPGTEITAVVGLTGHGTWTIGRDHTSVVFTPAAGFSGKATARYTIAVPGSGTATAIITVTVGAPPGFAVHTGGSAPAPATASAPGGPLALLRHWLGAP
ncbi:MAG: Ig-like domain-containing protein, partial [Micrococcales bacterium]|nr:Ig-like domain-containing protein [Micrococcales bacterium]